MRLRTRRLIGLFAATIGLLLCITAVAGAQSEQVRDTVTAITVKSQVLGEERTILVRTPAGYRNGTDRFPVLYMTDGSVNIYHTAGTVSYLALMHRVPEMIVVGLPHPDRIHDLTPTNDLTRGPDWKSSGGAEKFLRFVETEVIPLVEKRYRSAPCRILAGHSLGGLFSVHAMITRPELFNGYIAASPSLVWDKQEVLNRTERFFADHTEFNKKFYFALGNEPGYLKSFNRLKDILTKNRPGRFEWKDEQFADEDHASIVLRAYTNGIEMMFADWRLPIGFSQLPSDKRLEAAEQFYRALSKKYGYTIQIPESVLNGIGAWLVYEKKIDQAVSLLKGNVERFPSSPVSLNYLANAYEAAGDLRLAARYYRRAYVLGKRYGDGQASSYKSRLDRIVTKLDKKGGQN